ncbi:MAG: NAD-dependent epimerase/dehydratase family protein [Patescibacteria group bacterium]
MDKQTIFITGAAGYVGAMLVQKFAARDDVERVVGLDKEPLPEILRDIEKLVYIEQNTAEDWEPKVGEYKPTVVIHAAWQIREFYGDRAKSWRWNIDGSDKVFTFCFEHPVLRLIHFSTVASYGAFTDNTIEHRFVESEPFRKSEYLYAEEKRVAEEHLEQKYATGWNRTLAVSVVRPAAITGPRGRFMRIRFGLQSTLSGQMRGAFIYRLISAMVAFVPITPKWARQFIHEDDVVGIVERLAFGPRVEGYEVFNICPPGKVVEGRDMGRAVGKHIVPVYPWMVRFAFFVFWHLSRGKVPTGKGAWKGYSYPIVVDGSKVTRVLGYTYKHEGLDAFYYTDGLYASFVPEELRRPKIT